MCVTAQSHRRFRTKIRPFTRSRGRAGTMRQGIRANDGETGTEHTARRTRGGALPIRTRPERDALVEQYLPLVRHVASRLPVAMPPGFDRDDLFGAGTIGLVHAAETWDPLRGASFKTFAYTAIRGAILDELRRLDPLPRPRRDRLRRMRRMSADLRAELGREPSLDEIAARMGVTRADLAEDVELLRVTRVVSLDELRSLERSDVAGDVAELDTPGPVDLAERKDLVERVAQAIGELPDPDRRVAVLYHHDGLYLKEIGTLLGISESRVCQILGRAHARLRRVVIGG